VRGAHGGSAVKPVVRAYRRGLDSATVLDQNTVELTASVVPLSVSLVT